jgi:hypothetical protein
MVPTIIQDIRNGRPIAIVITNVTSEEIQVARDSSIGMWLSGDNVPRLPGFVSGRSRCYAEW